jgi:hypothetical protein
MHLSYQRTHDGAHPDNDITYTDVCRSVAEMVEDGWVDAFFNPRTGVLTIACADRLAEGLAAILPEVMAEMGCAVSAPAEA